MAVVANVANSGSVVVLSGGSATSVTLGNGATATLSGGSALSAVVGSGAFGGWTALHLANLGAQVELIDSWGAGNPIIRQLLDAGSDVNARNNYRGTALMVATGKYGHVRTVQLLIDAGADVNDRDNFGNTALWYAKSHHAQASYRALQDAGGEE